MKLRALLSALGLAVMVGGCAKPKKVEVPPRPHPVVVEKREEPKPVVKYKANGYEISLKRDVYDSIRFTYIRDNDGISACLDLNEEGKDWVGVCSNSASGKVDEFNNYTRGHECKRGVKKKNCTPKMYEDAQALYDKWKGKLGVEKVHQEWLRKKDKPFEDWK